MSSAKKMPQVHQTHIGVALQNLPAAETVNQMIDNLNFLCEVMDEAFNSIHDQVAMHRGKIKDITTRVETVRAKTETIGKFPNKATTVFSSGKYPKARDPKSKGGGMQTEKPLVDMVTTAKKQKRPDYKLSMSQRLARPKYGDTLTLFKSLAERTARANQHADGTHGIGQLPEWVESVSDCLLFDTDANPYVKYEEREALLGEDAKEKDKEEGADASMHAQPISIAQGKSIMDTTVGEFDIDYQPDLGDVPQFVADATLTGLGGAVAFDETWQGTGGFGIAPSAVGFDALPDLNMLPSMDTDLSIDPMGGGSTLASISGFKPVISAAPGALGGGPSHVSSTSAASVKSGKKRKKTGDAKKKKKKKKAKTPKMPKKQAAAAPVSGRNALLDAIRGVSGAQGLKKSSRTRARKVKQKPLPPKRMSLMDHLKARLEQRNNIMQGHAPKIAQQSAGDLGTITEASEVSFGSKKKTKARATPRKKKEEDPMGLLKLPRHMTQAMISDDAASGSAPDSEDWGD